jgi:hypothetical protein
VSETTIIEQKKTAPVGVVPVAGGGKGTKSLSKAFTNGLVYSPGSGALSRSTNVKALQFGQRLRDEWLFQFPLLGAAVMAYTHIAVSREWTVVGTPRRAAKAVETLNSTRFMDRNGEIHGGWSAYQFRRVMDYLCLGRNAFLKPRGGGSVLQYVDPVEVRNVGQPTQGKDRVIRARTKYDSQKTWNYLDTDWRRDELYMSYASPMSGTGYAPVPLLSILPSARMAYLIREHDIAKADGRKIRDIYIVADEQMQQALADAIVANVALYNGASVTEHGIPIVSAGASGMFDTGVNVGNLFGRLGLAEIDDGLDRSEFWLDYAQEIAAILDLPLRVFWNDPRGSNRSLEKVTQERARRQGPAFYILSEERLINNTGILGDRVRFQFVEEADMSLIKDRAEVAKVYAEAIEKLKTAMPKFSGEAIRSWLQQLGVLPRDEDLLDEIATISESPVQAEDMVDGDIETMLEEQTADNLESELEVTEDFALAQQPQVAVQVENSQTEGAEEVTEKVAAQLREAKSLADYMRNQRVSQQPGYGEVVLNCHGEILEHRERVFHISAALKAVVESDNAVDSGITADEYDQESERMLEDAFAVSK